MSLLKKEEQKEKQVFFSVVKSFVYIYLKSSALRRATLAPVNPVKAAKGWQNANAFVHTSQHTLSIFFLNINLEKRFFARKRN